jgi:hypothetical protein
MEVSFCGSQVFYAKEVLADLYKDLKGLRFVISCTLTKKSSLSQAPQLIKGEGKKEKSPYDEILSETQLILRTVFMDRSWTDTCFQQFHQFN